MANVHTDSDQIEADLARTRARMDDRLDQLQDHLSPRQMLNDVFAYFHGGDGSDIAQDLVSRVRANPIPLALVGVGIAWLMASDGTAGPAAMTGEPIVNRLREVDRSNVRIAGEDQEAYRSRLDEARGLVLGIARDPGDTADSYSERVRTAVSAATRGARDKTHDLTQAAGDLAERATRQGTELKQGADAMAHSTRDTLSTLATNPFALGAIAAVVGAVAGALLPTLEQEESALATTATKIREKGRDLAQDVADRGTRIATETLGAVQDSASSHGLTADKPVGDIVAELKSGDLVGHVKAVAQETLEAGQDSARKHLEPQTDA
jgi:hypothetical protein